MSLFDDVIVNAAAAVDTFGKVAGDVVDRSRARVSSAELKGKINKQFETLGRYIYDTSVSGTTDQSVVDEYVSNISVLIGELKSLQDTLTADLGRIICPKCCTKNSVDSLFCKKCGSTLDFANSYTAPKAEDLGLTLEKKEEEPASEETADDSAAE